MSSPDIALQRSYQTPSPVSSLAFGDGGHLFAGSDDGSMRIYHVDANRVLKAIRGLGSEVSSIVLVKPRNSDMGNVWLACGRQAILYQLDSEKLVLQEDASSRLDLGEGDDDVLNELALSPNERFLAFTSDSGSVGTVELGDMKVHRMKTRHQNICGTVKFISDRPGELVSGGYDSALLHARYPHGDFLSRLDLTSLPPISGISLSPPFILSTAISPVGVLAAGTADGRLLVCAGGQKRAPGVSKKRSRKWDGLKENESVAEKIAEGPIVAVVWIEADTLITCTLLGVLSMHRFKRDPNVCVEAARTWQVHNIVKVNTVAIHGGRWLAIGGFGKDGKGVIELWRTAASDVDTA